MIGQRVSHYEIEALLGEGAMGRVYRARDTVLERRVALKLVSAGAQADASFLERFLREARLAAHLNHPNIATIHEFGQHEGTPFLVMELVHGETLADRLVRGPLEPADVRRIGAQAAAALAEAHAAGIVHRDIKPGNLMLTRAGLVKVMDFGVARRAGETAITVQGGIVGTPKTMAPELLRGQEPSPAADLFSLGCVLYEALAGQAPFTASDAMAVLYQIAQQEPEPLQNVRPDVPGDLALLVHALLVKDPARRLGPAAAVAAALAGTAAPASADSEATATIGATALQTFPGIAVPPAATPADGTAAGAPFARRPSRRQWLVLGATLVVVAAVAYVAVRRGGGEAMHRRALAQAQNDECVARLRSLEQAGIQRARPESVAAARACFEHAAELDRSYAVPWNNLGHVARIAGDLEAAEREFRRATELDTAYAVARLNLAGVLEERGRLAEAEAEYRRALASDSTLIQAPNNLGALLARTGRGEEALEILGAALRRWPQVAPLWRNYGKALLDAGRPESADSALARALEIDPDEPATLEARARAAAIRGSVGEALAQIERAMAARDSVMVAVGAGRRDSLAIRDAAALRDSLRRLLPRPGRRGPMRPPPLPPAPPHDATTPQP